MRLPVFYPHLSLLIHRTLHAKPAVWVQFLAPPTHAGFKCSCILDLGITKLTSARVTAAMLLAFSDMNRSPVSTASGLDDTETMTSQ